jgi:hypothetical protein
MNANYVANELDSTAGVCSDFSRAKVKGIILTAALAGNLTVTGVTNSDGTPSSWVINSGSSGWQAPPGSGYTNRLTYVYANGADAGSAVVLLTPM